MYSARIYSYIYLRLLDHSQAEDVTGQVFYKMVEKIGDYRQRGAAFPAWLFRIAHNQVVDTQRSLTRKHTVPFDNISEMHELHASDGSDPYKYAERRDAVRHLNRCISQLSSLQAQVISLRYAAELSNPEIAQVMSRSTNAVNSLHYEALKKLGKLMEETGYTL